MILSVFFLFFLFNGIIEDYIDCILFCGFIFYVFKVGKLGKFFVLFIYGYLELVYLWCKVLFVVVEVGYFCVVLD